MIKLSQLKDMEEKNMVKANHVYTFIEKIDAQYSSDGFHVASFKLADNRKYDIYVISNVRPTKVNMIGNWIKNGPNPPVPMDEYDLNEYFFNDLDWQLKFDSEAYFRIVNQKNPDEVKFIFTDYNEAVEYLELIEKSFLN